MGTVTITVDAGAAGTATRTFTVTNANLGRLAEFGKRRLRGMGPPLDPAPTNAEGLEAWAKWAMQMTRDHVVGEERQQATVADFGVS